MSFYNLSSYVKYGLFLQDMLDNNPYDLIIFERKFESDFNVSGFDLKFLDQDGDNFVGQINYCLSKYSNVLLILDESNSRDVFGGLEIKSNLSVVNLHVGISGLGNKNNLEHNDIGYLLNLGFDVYEPWDMNNFLKNLLMGGKKYLRLTDNDLPQNLVYFEEFAIVDQKLLDAKDVISFVNNGYNGFDGTVLAGGSLLSNAAQALRILSDNNLLSFDLFCISKLDFDLDAALINSLKKTNMLIILIDQSYPNGYQEYVKSKLKTQGYESIRVKFIYPEYDKLNTVMNEYKLEQSGFDGLAIANKINNIMKA